MTEKVAIRPSVEASGVLRGALRAEAQAVRQGTKSVLLIEDQSGPRVSLQLVIPMMLKRAAGVDAIVIAPDTAEEALEQLRTTRFDVVLLDGDLGAWGTQLNGPGIARSMRGGDYGETNRHSKIMNISNNSNTERQYDVASLGPVESVLKLALATDDGARKLAAMLVDDAEEKAAG